MTKKLLVSLALLLFIISCSSDKNDAFFQVSTINSLLSGNYNGYFSCDELLKRGNFGIGTFDRLDGEMIILNGTVYQVKGDGSIIQPTNKIKTPFGAVKYFSTDTTMKVNRKSFHGLEQFLDSCLSDQSLFYAFKIEGTFSTMRTRSLFAQEPPYRDLVDIPMQKFSASNIRGTLVGFRYPHFVKGLNVPGYHLHFISDDRKFGGHVLDFNLKEGNIMTDISSEFQMLLPKDKGEFANTKQKDRSDELHKVERMN